MYKVIIVEDHEIFANGIKSLLNTEKFEIIGEESLVQNAVRKIAKLKPDVVLLDIHLPDGTGDQIIREVYSMNHNNREQIHFLALSVSDDLEDVTKVISQGALGYITKTVKGDELNAALEQVALGFTVFSPKLAGFVLTAFENQSDTTRDTSTDKTAKIEAKTENNINDEVDEKYYTLSKKEREILEFIARGWTYKEIANELFISIKTVESHVSHVLKKLQLTNRNQITHWALKNSLV